MLFVLFKLRVAQLGFEPLYIWDEITQELISY